MVLRLLTLTLACTMFLAACGQSTTAIERVLREDAAASSGATSVGTVVARMRAINLDGCPREFKEAYLAHIHAWEQMADVEQQAVAFAAKSESGSVMVEAFIRGFLGDPLGTASELKAEETQLQREYNAARRQVKVTFDRVEQIATAHGARLPTP